MGAVTIPAATPCCASCTARTIASPLNRPASALASVASRSFQSPTSTSTGTPALHGPTMTRSHASRTRGSASAATTISGPMPRGSPRLTASRGRVDDPRDTGASVTSSESQRDVGLLAQLVQDLARLLLGGELRADVVPHLGERVLARRGVRDDLHHRVLHGPVWRLQRERSHHLA